MKLLNYNIFNDDLENVGIDHRQVINTLNPHSYCMAKKDPVFDNALKQSEILVPDGTGIVLAARFIKGKKIKKIAGYDVFMHLMHLLNQAKGSCFFLGASQKTLDLIHKKTNKEFPNVTVNSFSPPFKEEFSQAETKLMVESVNKHNPKVLFVGMTAPKQEKWVYANRDNLNVDVICSIGAVFDFYAGTVKRSSEFWIDIGLEWLPRFLKDPKRLAARNLVSTPKFLLEILSFKMFNKGIL